MQYGNLVYLRQECKTFLQMSAVLLLLPLILLLLGLVLVTSLVS